MNPRGTSNGSKQDRNTTAEGQRGLRTHALQKLGAGASEWEKDDLNRAQPVSPVTVNFKHDSSPIGIWTIMPFPRRNGVRRNMKEELQGCESGPLSYLGSRVFDRRCCESINTSTCL